MLNGEEGISAEETAGLYSIKRTGEEGEISLKDAYAKIQAGKKFLRQTNMWSGDWP